MAKPPVSCILYSIHMLDIYYTKLALKSQRNSVLEPRIFQIYADGCSPGPIFAKANT
jgi:hypothetical protein